MRCMNLPGQEVELLTAEGATSRIARVGNSAGITASIENVGDDTFVEEVGIETHREVTGVDGLAFVFSQDELDDWVDEFFDAELEQGNEGDPPNVDVLVPDLFA